MRCCTRFRSSLSGKAASVYILSLYSRAGSCSTASVVNIDFGQRPIGVSTDLRRRVLHRVRRVFHPPLPRAARVGTGWASAAFNFALRSFVNAACSLHGRGRAPRLPRPARCRSCRPPSDSARCRVPARFSSLVCCRCAGSRSRARYSSILTREHSSGVFSGRMFPAGVLRSFGDCCPTVGDDAPVLATTCRSAGRAGTVVGKGGPAGPRRAEFSAHQ